MSCNHDIIPVSAHTTHTPSENASLPFWHHHCVLYVTCSGKTGNKSPAASDWFQIMVSDNQYFQFVKDMLLEEVICEKLIHSAYNINQNLPTIHGLNKVM